MRTIAYAGLMIFASLPLLAQTAPAAFEVASIKPNLMSRGGGEGSRRETIQVAPGSLIMTNVNLISCIKWAYSIQEYQISGPGWLDSERFDIAAKAAGPAPDNELRSMLQALLAERFKLTFHRQTKEMAAYAVTVGKNGHKMHASEGDGPVTLKPNGRLGGTARYAVLSELAALMSRGLRTPVIDMTGLTGKFDFTIDLAPYLNEEMMKRGPGDPPPDIAGLAIVVMQEQLGLKMEPRKLAVEMLIIDSVEKTPTEN